MPRKERFRNDGAAKGVKERLQPDVLRRLYVEQGLTQAIIAERFGCSPQFISRLVAEYNLQRVPGHSWKRTNQA
jgi:hypothetical protein